MKGIFKALQAFALILLFVLWMTVANLLALYIVAGVVLRGDWDRIHSSIERAYDEFFNDNE